MDDYSRYIWLLANMGRVEEEAKAWDPSKHKPLLVHLHDFIDREGAKESNLWFKEQTRILKK